YRGGRPAGAHADLAAAAGARRLLAGDPVLPQRALAGAAVLLHVPAALRVHRLRAHHPLPRLGEGNPRPLAAGHGQRVGGGARRCRVAAVRPMGGGRVARLLAPPDPLGYPPAAVREAHAAPVAEPLLHPHHGDGAGVHRRRFGDDDAGRPRARRRESSGAADPLLRLRAALLLRLLLPHRRPDPPPRAPLAGEALGAAAYGSRRSLPLAPHHEDG